MAVSIDCVVASRSRLGEGAVWDVDDARLWWVDIRAGLVHCHDPAAGTNDSFEVGEQVSSLARRDAGGLVITTESGLYLFDPAEGSRTCLATPEAHLEGNRFNDGTTDPKGRFWAGTMRDDGAPPERRGRFYRLDADHQVSQHFDPVFTTNGLAFSPDGTVMYYADTNRDVQTVWACDYDADNGTPTNSRVFFHSGEIAGRPDGATVDADGCYWFAGVGGWQVVRVTPQGKLDRVIEMPVEKPSKVMFGGAGLDVLFVTSIGDGVGDRSGQPEAGSLFAITGTGTTGLPQARFAG